MKVLATSDSPAQIPCSALVVMAFDDAQLTGSAEQLNKVTGGTLQRLWDRGEFSGKLGRTAVFP